MVDFSKLLNPKIKRCYCDTETTGTKPTENAIIQWTAKIVIDGNPVDSLNLAIQPHEDAVIEETALEANGVTHEELFGPDRLKPRDAYMAIQEFLGAHCDKYNRNDKYFFLGFKAPFDADFTREMFKLQGDNYYGSFFWVPPCCIMSLAGHLLQKERQKLENFKLKTVYEYLFPDKKYSEEEWHDALFDIDRTIELEEELRRRITAPTLKYKNKLRSLAMDLRTPPSIVAEINDLLGIQQSELPLK